LSYWPASGAEAAHALFGRRSTLVLGLALFAALALIRTVVVVGVGDRLTENHPEAALKLGRDSPEVLASAALNAWQAKDARRSSKYAMAALDRSPLNVHALRTRGLSLEALGKGAQAESLMQFAGSRSWRDDGVQAWLLRDDIANHRLADAFLHVDALARRRVEMWPILFRLFDVGAADPEAAKVIADLAGKEPYWRSSFLESLAASKQKDPAVERMFQLVDQGPAPLTASEISFYLRRLDGEGRYRDSFAALGRYKNGRQLVGSPFDGGFTGRDGAAPFAWETFNKPGENLEMDPAPDRASSNALRVEYDGYSATDLIRQTLAPQPGDYLLTGEVRPQDGDPGVLAWQARCVSGGKVLATASPPPGTATNVWSRFAVRFTVPAQGCDGVWLVLAESPQDHRSSNVTWYANLAIRAAPAATSPK
jgi:hypothetical protein